MSFFLKITKGMEKHTKKHIQRPNFYPCETCPNKFTVRALIVHKTLCTKNADCCCSRCVKILNSLSQDQLLDGAYSLAHTNTNLVCNKNNTDINCSRMSSNQNGASTESRTQDDTYVQTGTVSLPTLDSCNSKYPHSNDDKGQFSAPEFLEIEKRNECHLSTDATTSTGLLYNTAPILEISDIKIELSERDISNNSGSSLKPNDPIISGNTTNCPKRELLCGLCNSFLPWQTYGSHVIQHTELVKSEIVCPKCTKKFTEKAMFLIHFNEHMSNCPFLCKSCMIPFHLCDELKSHTLKAHGYVEALPFHCYICKQRFSRPQIVTNHMQLHANERPFTYEACSRAINPVKNFQHTLSILRGFRRYQCSECGKFFRLLSALRTHVRVRTEKKPFVCQICMREFSQSNHLKLHAKIHLPRKYKDTPPPTIPQSDTHFFDSIDVKNHVSETLNMVKCKKSNLAVLVKREELDENSVSETVPHNGLIPISSYSKDPEIHPPSKSGRLFPADETLLGVSAIALSQLKEQLKTNN